MIPDRELSASGSLSSHEVQKSKKRRLHGACDACRKKKIKCDSANMPGNNCTNCQLSNIKCTHDIPRQPKKSETQAAYIQSLEEKVEKMLGLLQRAYPGQDIDLLLDLPPDEVSEDSSPAPHSMAAGSSTYTALKYSVPHSISKELRSSASPPSDIDDDTSEAEDLAHLALSEHFKQLSLDAVDDRFFGQSSAFMFFKHASTVRSEITGRPNKPDASKFRRPKFWNIQPWELAFASTQELNYIYPEDDFLRNLVSIYFEKINPLFPLLHQPTFLRMLFAGEHHKDPSFGMTVLLVCAVASRYSNDPRVMMPGDTSGLSSGWRYFCQVPMHRPQLLIKSASIYDLQYYALALLYLHGTSIPNTGWHVLGLGMRHALEKGAHRRKPNSQKPSAEEELMKRAFWCLVCIDRYMSSFLGRPCLMNDEDFDVDYPIECDDEYWETEDPEQAFKQPPGLPCTITGFVCALKLCEILAFTLRTLYSTKKSKILSGLIGNEWENRLVAELNSSLDKWKVSLPHFLRWNPESQDSLFFHQSVYLYATYYYIQIMIHRPFLTKKSSLSIPSLAMCTNAARSCARILEASLTRGVRITTPNIFMAAVSAGISIILNLWGNQHSGLIGDSSEEMENLQKCVNVLKACEKRYPMAGRMCDLLNEVASLKDYQPTLNKRQRDSSATAHPRGPFTEPTFTDKAPKQVVTVPELPRVTSSTTNIQPTYDTAATMPANDWDLSNLLLVQMGYVQTNPGNNFNQQFDTPIPSYIPRTTMPQMATGNTAYATTPKIVNSEYAPAPLVTDDLFSPWSDMSFAFHSVDEWNAYLANVAKS